MFVPLKVHKMASKKEPLGLIFSSWPARKAPNSRSATGRADKRFMAMAVGRVNPNNISGEVIPKGDMAANGAP
jgi:hypothetical protein